MGCGVREIVERILQGKYEYAEKKLDFSTPRIELLVSSGETSEGSFTIFGPEDKLVTGKVSSTEIRMEVLTENFSGSPYEVSYRFNSRGLSQGDVLKGDFRIVSNQGEYVLPFVVTVRHEQIASSLPTFDTNIQADEVKGYLIDALTVAIKMRDAEAQKRGNDIINNAVDYINEHYADEDISLDSVRSFLLR